MDTYIEVHLCSKREQITATHNNMDGSHRQNAEQVKPTQKHMGLPRSRCQNGIRYARDLIGGKPVKNKGREQESAWQTFKSQRRSKTWEWRGGGKD